MNQPRLMVQPTGDRFAAFVVGATGNVGTHLVDTLIDSPRCTRVTAIARRPLRRSSSSPKLHEVIWEDFEAPVLERPELAVEALRGHQVGFCCLGASKHDMMRLLVAPKRVGRVFARVDRDYVVGIATSAARAEVPCLSVISSPGADPHAWFTYLRLKGEMERAVEALGFDGLTFFHPGTLVVKPERRGPRMERWLARPLGLLDRLLPTKYRGTPVEDLAEAMRVQFEQRRSSPTPPVARYEANAIRELARRDRPAR